MIIGVLKEPSPETRVSLLPEHIAILKKWNVDVYIENNAGATAFANDEKYTEAGAIIKSRSEVLQGSDFILSVNTLPQSEIANLKSEIRNVFDQRNNTTKTNGEIRRPVNRLAAALRYVNFYCRQRPQH